MAEGQVELKFRIDDGTDIGHDTYSSSTSVATLKQILVEIWPQDRSVTPQSVSEIKLIHAGRFLNDGRTLAESRVHIGGDLGGFMTIHVVVQPPTEKTDWSVTKGVIRAAASRFDRKYMHKGLSVWLDVPLEALARRIAEDGTDSRPLLNGESGDAYTKAFKRLSSLLEQRGEAYANANARVSLEDMAVKYACKDVCKITPVTIALEALIQVENFLKNQGGRLH